MTQQLQVSKDWLMIYQDDRSIAIPVKKIDAIWSHAGKTETFIQCGDTVYKSPMDMEFISKSIGVLNIIEIETD